MTIYKIDSIDRLKRIALRITEWKTFNFVEVINNGNIDVGVNLQVSNWLFRNNKPGTYNVNRGVLVFVENSESIFVLPYCQSFRDILDRVNYEVDESIYTPGVTTNSLKGFFNRIKWKIALTFCNT